jgi:probable F420-dependent oxidoreductase
VRPIPVRSPEAAAELEELGYGTIWVPGGADDDAVFRDVGRLLDATTHIVVATGIVNVWMHEPAALTASYAALEDAHPGRFLLGIGISYVELIDRVRPGLYERPLTAMQRYLDELDALPEPIPVERRVIAALAPKMLTVARERACGSHTYIVPPAHTRSARQALGDGRLLAPGVPVVVDSDAGRARALGRDFLANPYSGLRNYRNAWLRSGFSEADVADAGSDALVDGLVAWGDDATVAARIVEQLDAGADHVCMHVVSEDRCRLPREEWRRLAAALL